MNHVHRLGFAYFFIFLSVYLTHNYLFKLIKANVDDLSFKQYSILDMLLVSKFFGTFFWATLADRTRKPRLIVAFGLVLSNLCLGMFIIAPEWCKARGLNTYTVLYKLTYTFFLSSVFGTMDALSLDYLETIGDKGKWWSWLKIYGCMGHVSAHGLVALIALINNKEKSSGNYQVMIANLISIAGGLYIIIYLKGMEKKTHCLKKPKKVFSLFSNLSYINELCSFDLLLFVLAVLPQGIHRQATSTFLDEYLSKMKMEKTNRALIFAIRCLPELIVSYLSRYLESMIGLYWMLLLAIIFGVSRPSFYALVSLDEKNENKNFIFFMIMECAKGMLSGLLGYSAAKIGKRLATPNTTSLAQGVYTGIYNGFGPFLCGLLGYLLLGGNALMLYESVLRGFFLLTAVIGGVGFLFAIWLSKRARKRKIMKVESLKSVVVDDLVI